MQQGMSKLMMNARQEVINALDDMLEIGSHSIIKAAARYSQGSPLRIAPGTAIPLHGIA